MAKTIKTITMTQPEAYLKVIIGPMWSGKSTEVINIYKYNQIAQIPTLVVNFAEDKRYHETKLSTHDKMMIPCIRFMKLAHLLDYKELHNYKSIVIDEAQFFEDLYNFVKMALELDFHIIVCGLNGNFKQEKFGQILELIPLANNVELLKGYCMVCKDGTEGIFTKRILDNNTDEINVGNDDKYMCVCRKHL